MTDLKARFDATVTNSKNLSERPDNATLLKLYGLYKQGCQGDNGDPKPGFGDIVARAKWEAWNSCSGMAAHAAMQNYIDLVESLR